MSKHIMLLVFLFLISTQSSFAQETDQGRAYYDMGVFAYEDSDFIKAEGYFLKAIERNYNNAYYHHFLGKTYFETERYDEAEKSFSKAYNINPEIPDLRYDMAFLDYKTGDYKNAADRFGDIALKEPENALAHYYAGISRYMLKRYNEAIIYLEKASELSPTIKENGYYYIGICLKESGYLDQAAERLKYVIANSDSEVLRSNARKWLDEIDRINRTRKPFSTYLKTGIQYDDNVRLDPLDQDLFANEDDYLFFGYLSGKYNFINSEKNRLGVGYSYYQTKHDDLGAYDLTGSMLNLNMMHRFSRFTFDLSYMPSYYWLDSRSYLMTHRVKPEIIFNITRRLNMRISYSWYRNKYFQDPGKSGDRNEGLMEIYYLPWKQGGYITFGIGYEDNDSDHPDEDFERSSLRAGVLFPPVFNTSILISGSYKDKQYDNMDSVFDIKREDDKYSGTISLSHRFFYDWLRVGIEYNYIKKDSNIDTYSYERNITTISLTARF